MDRVLLEVRYKLNMVESADFLDVKAKQDEIEEYIKEVSSYCFVEDVTDYAGLSASVEIKDFKRIDNIQVIERQPAEVNIKADLVFIAEIADFDNEDFKDAKEIKEYLEARLNDLIGVEEIRLWGMK